LPTTLDFVARLAAAIAAGLAIGFNRNLTGKPLGMRTLALVSLSAAIVTLSAISFLGFDAPKPAMARVLQGIIEGVMTGMGFIGAGVILRDREAQTVHGLTTAASVWVTAALGIACGLAAWPIAISGTLIAVAVLVVLRWVESRWHIVD